MAHARDAVMSFIKSCSLMFTKLLTRLNLDLVNPEKEELPGGDKTELLVIFIIHCCFCHHLQFYILRYLFFNLLQIHFDW